MRVGGEDWRKKNARLDRDHLGALGDRLARRRAIHLDGLVGLDHLQQLQHRLVVLVLVGEQHVVDEAVGQQGIARLQVDLIEHLERALADPVHIGTHLVGLQDRQLTADLARLLDRVVELAQVAAQRLAAADVPDQPQLLEVADVAQVPDQRAQDRRVDAVELFLRERLDQLERVSARLREAVCDRGLRIGGRRAGNDPNRLHRH
jgi:hypothetical protein